VLKAMFLKLVKVVRVVLVSVLMAMPLAVVFCTVRPSMFRTAVFEAAVDTLKLKVPVVALMIDLGAVVPMVVCRVPLTSRVVPVARE
jgi:hypothetical protein